MEGRLRASAGDDHAGLPGLPPQTGPGRANEDKRLASMISEADLARDLPDKEVSRFVEAEVSHSV